MRMRSPCVKSVFGSTESTSCLQCPVHKQSLFVDLNQGQIQKLDELKTSHSVSAGAIIFDQGAPVRGVFCLRTGAAKVTQKDSGDVARFVRMAKCGDTVGHRSLFSHENYVGQAEAIESTQYCFIDSKTMKDLISENSDVAFRLIRRIGRDLDHVEAIQSGLRGRSIRERVAALLLRLDKSHGVNWAPSAARMNRRWIGLALKKTDISTMLGVANETIIRTMSQFRAESILSYEDKRLILEDIPALRAIARQGQEDHD